MVQFLVHFKTGAKTSRDLVILDNIGNIVSHP